MSYPRCLRQVTGLALLLAGATAGPSEAQTPAGHVISSDPALAALASELLPDLARRSGMELKEPVRVEMRSREQLVRYLEHKLDEELPPDEAAEIVDVYALLGLVPADLDLREVLMGLYTEQVSGFYEPDSTALFVLDDQREEDLRGLLVHELVHAVQDQSVDLDYLTDPDRGSDRATAAQAAIEGHATLVMFEYVAEQQMGQPVDLSRIPGFGQLLRQNLEGIRSQFPALASAPRVFQETLIFPYLEGAVFLQAKWAEGARVVPFGDHMPESTEQVLDGSGARAPVELVIEASGGEIVRDDVIGRLELGILLAEHVGPDRADAAEGWEGDRYALLELPDGSRALAWFVLWDGEAARDGFAEAIGSALDRFAGPATIERLRVAGYPATRLTVGAIDPSMVRVSRASAR